MDMHKKFTDRIGPVVTKSHVDLPFEPNTRSCQEWVDDLPILDAASTAGMMLTATQGLLSTTVAPYTEFKISEVVSPYVIKLTILSLKTIENSNLPLSQKQAKLSTQILNILTNTQNVYQNIVRSTCFIENNFDKNNNNKSVFSEHEKGLIIFRAIELQGIIQLFDALVYRPTDHNFWNNLNALYMLAEGLNIHQLEYLTIDKRKHTTIENEFKKNHFFHLASPNRFNRHDIKTIQRILSIQANNILISSKPQASATFYIDISLPKPASHLINLNINDHCRFIDNEKLLKFICSDHIMSPKRYDSISLMSDKPTLSKITIQRLLPSWSTFQNRRSVRHEKIEEVLVYPGFDSIIRALVIEQNPEHFNNKSAQQQKNSINFNVENLEIIPMELHQRNYHKSSNALVNKALKATAESTLKETNKYSLSAEKIWKAQYALNPGEKGEKVTAHIGDSSLQGLRFNITSNNKPLLKACDIICLKSKNGLLQLAIIRRINKLDDGDISVGVEMMSPSLKIANINFHDKELHPKPVIFLQSIPNIHQPDSIITPFLLDNTTKNIALITKGNTDYYRIGTAIETNQVFNHYTVLKETNLD
ncbi:MAG: GTPase-translation elongation factor [Cycloclasticus sp.]|uniref:GTPase-translation elongation factor n=1 Tax=Cycloclasticus sp. TaxID=2024830 RepID=UPI00257B7BFE|nr:GTPase-translation elongation factor [Cycloclasticus sp.]MBV1898926.1 GTPase-translation elongation factor [Cycloclasticus sp.]